MKDKIELPPLNEEVIKTLSGVKQHRFRTLYRRAQFLHTRINSTDKVFSYDNAELASLIWFIELATRCATNPDISKQLNLHDHEKI